MLELSKQLLLLGRTVAVPFLRAVDLTQHHDVAATAEDVRKNFPLALMLSSIAGASTGLGGLLMVLQKDLTYRKLGLWQGAAAGFMISVSLFDLIPSALEDLEMGAAFIYFMVGALLFMSLKRFVPEPNLEILGRTKDLTLREVLWSGLLTAVGISIHNFPEGAAVCIASLRGIQFGLPLALAIGLHNLPEGFSVALPVYFVTKDKGYAVGLAFLSGMAEPAGVLFVILLVHLRGSLTRGLVSSMLSAVAGIMVALSVAELYPQSYKHSGLCSSLLATFAGLALMTLLLFCIDNLGLGV